MREIRTSKSSEHVLYIFILRLNRIGGKTERMIKGFVRSQDTILRLYKYLLSTPGLKDQVLNTLNLITSDIILGWVYNTRFTVYFHKERDLFL